MRGWCTRNVNLSLLLRGHAADRRAEAPVNVHYCLEVRSRPYICKRFGDQVTSEGISQNSETFRFVMMLP